MLALSCDFTSADVGAFSIERAATAGMADDVTTAGKGGVVRAAMGNGMFVSGLVCCGVAENVRLYDPISYCYGIADWQKGWMSSSRRSVFFVQLPR